MNEDVKIVLCVPLRFSGLLGAELREDLEKNRKLVDCPECREPMYVGAEGEKLVQNNEATFLCMACGILSGAVDKNTPIRKLT